MAVDVSLVEMIAGDATINGIIGTGTAASARVYHVEVMQSTGTALQKYPCSVYEIESDHAVAEIAGRSGVREAVFTLMFFSKDSKQLRDLQNAFDALALDQATAEAAGFLWLFVDDITDGYDVPFEYDEKAMLHVALSVRILYADPA